MGIKYIRTCQECGNKQESLSLYEWRIHNPDEEHGWCDCVCRKCESPALDYGQWIEEN